MRFFFSTLSCAMALGASAWEWPEKCKPSYHEGVAVNSCLKHCVATPQVSVNRDDYEQFYWQHCNGTVYTASYSDKGEGLQGNKGGTVYTNASTLVKNARLLSAGQDIGLVVLENGDVMGFGKNTDGGKLGIGDDLVGDTIYDGAQVVLPGKAKSVSASYQHSLFVTNDGKAYAAGRNSNGVFCRPTSEMASSGTPLQVPLPEDAFVVDVSAGRYHSLFLTRDGRVYACGSNDHGRLGIGNTDGENYDAPQLVLVQDLVAIAAGDRHSVFLQRGGVAWVTGSNSVGRIGLGESVREVGTPTKLDLEHVVAISAGEDHSMFLLCDGTVYGSGDNGYFQLAVGHNEAVYTPTKSYYEDVVAIAVSDYLGMFLTSDGNLYISGTYEYYEVAFPFGAQVTGFGWQNRPLGGLPPHRPHRGMGFLRKFERQGASAADFAPGGTVGLQLGPAAGVFLALCLLSIIVAATLPTLRRARAMCRSRDKQADAQPLVDVQGDSEDKTTSGACGQQVR